MPIYEFICQDCRNPFETLVRGSATPECPTCHSTRLEKQLSVFTQGKPALTTVVPAALVPRERAHAHPREGIGEPDAVEDS